MTNETSPTTEAPAVEQGKTVNATVYYRLSDVGQRAALVAGLSAAREQSVTGPIALADMDLCAIMPDGAVVCATYSIPAAQPPAGLVGYRSHQYTPYWPVGGSHLLTTHVDASYSTPPASAQAAVTEARALCAALAAKEAEAKAQRDAWQAAAEAKRAADREAEYARIQAALDADPTAIPGCRLAYSWDVSDHPLAVEIRRRKQAQADAAEQANIATAKIKSDFVGAFLARHGTSGQLERFAVGMLPQAEYSDAMRALAFAPLDDYAQYERITNSEAFDALDEDTAGNLDDDTGAVFRSHPAKEASAAEWATLKAIKAIMPSADVTLRLHQASFDRDDIPWGIVERKSILVTAQYGPFEFSRDYAV